MSDNHWTTEGTPRPEGQTSGPSFQPAGQQYGQPAGPGEAYRPQASTGPTQQRPAMGQGFGQAQQPAFTHGMPSQPTLQQAPAPKRRTGRLTAAFLGVAVLAAGVGGGSAVLAQRYLGGDAQPAASTATIDQDATGNSTTVVQADPNAPDWATVADVASQSVVAIQVVTRSGAGEGSGVIIDGDGNIITNNHVVNGAQQLLVTLGDQSFQAELVGTDPSTDLAVIRLVDPPADLTPMAWGDSNALVVGDPVMAIGNPLGLSGTVTTGIVSALDRPVTTQAVGQSQGETVVTAAIQTNAAINPGNSGGALVNSSGQLVGITTSIATLPSSSGSQSGNIGIGFAIGSDQAKHIADQLIANGSAVHPQIGVSATDTSTVGTMGAEVVRVVEGSPAASAGIQVGDVITAVNDRSVSSTDQLVGLVRAQQVGKPITVTLDRAGDELTLELTPVAAGQ